MPDTTNRGVNPVYAPRSSPNPLYKSKRRDVAPSSALVKGQTTSATLPSSLNVKALNVQQLPAKKKSPSRFGWAKKGAKPERSTSKDASSVQQVGCDALCTAANDFFCFRSNINVNFFFFSGSNSNSSSNSIVSPNVAAKSRRINSWTTWNRWPRCVKRLLLFLFSTFLQKSLDAKAKESAGGGRPRKGSIGRYGHQRLLVRRGITRVQASDRAEIERLIPQDEKRRTPFSVRHALHRLPPRAHPEHCTALLRLLTETTTRQSRATTKRRKMKKPTATIATTPPVPPD